MSLPTGQMINVTNSSTPIQTPYLVNTTNSSTLSTAARASTEFKNSSGVTTATTTRSAITPPSTITTSTKVSAAMEENSKVSLDQGFVPQTNHVSEGTDIAMSISHPVLHQSTATSSPTEQQDDFQVSSQPSYSGLGNAAPDSSPSPVQADLALQNSAQPEHTHFASLPAVTSAMAQHVSGPPILVLGSQTLTPGGQITVDNTPIYLLDRGSAIVINGESRAIGSSPTTITIGSNVLPITPLAASPIPGSSPEALTLDGQKLVPGSVITIDNTLVSLPSAGSALVINGKTIPTDSTAAGITIGSQVFPITPAPPLPTALNLTPHALTLDGQTLEPGSAITIDNTLVSLPPTGSLLIVNGKTVPIGSTPTGITIGSQIVSVTPDALGTGPTGLVLDGQTLKPGSVITIDNTPISLPPTGSNLIITGKTVPIGSAPTGITIGSEVVSVTPDALGPVPTGLVINGQMLQPGKALNISSDVEISLPAFGTDVVLISGTSSTTEALGPAILSGLEMAPTGTASFRASPGSSVVGFYSNGSAMAFTGGGGKRLSMRSQGTWVWEAMTMLGFLFSSIATIALSHSWNGGFLICDRCSIADQISREQYLLKKQYGQLYSDVMN
ncbi:MAG: hypothetical protein OHK93_003043 [Ramalina farinacea]|uniref:Uncharacterized protein n=1 Tax=Ramalina farinacea TaxID=258253 RepID=A0AA43QST2_9LECA|nr:hypothetical protein [Ramalina farinacea]